MARRADGGSRGATENAAGRSDELDAGWDDAPTSVTMPPKSTARALVSQSPVVPVRTISVLPKPATSSSLPAATRTTLPPPASVLRKVNATHSPSPSLPPVASAPRPSPSGRAPRALTERLSWMERATSLQAELGVSRRPSVSVRHEPKSSPENSALVSEESTLVREDPTLVREEPTLVLREDPTLVREDPTLVREATALFRERGMPVREGTTFVREAPTLEFSTEYLDEANIGAAEDAVAEYAIDELSLRVVAPAAERVRDDALFTGDSREAPLVAGTSPHADDIDVPDFRRHRLGGAMVIAAIGVAVALVVASVVSHQFPAAHAEPTAEFGAPRPAQEPAPLALPEPRSPEQAPSPTTPANEALDTATSQREAPVETSLEKASSAVAVTVKVIPARAVIFRAGEKLGSGTVQVSVERNAKQRLTALHDGYAPYNFTLDGSRDTVTVQLKPVPRPHPAAPHVSDSPFGASSDDSTGAAPPSAPTAAAPESTPEPESAPPTPSPSAKAGETPAE